MKINFDHEELRKKYNPEGSAVREAQLRMLDILVYISELCENNGLRYWLAGGTLLGAYRHAGFIPWDDDLDIEMPLEDMIKLKKIMLENPSKDYIFQDHSTDPYYFYSYSKIRDTHYLCESDSPDERFFKYKGVWVDIFPLEEHSIKMQKLSFYTNSYGRRFLVYSKFPLLRFLVLTRYYLNYKLLFPTLRFIAHLLPSSKGCYNKTLGCEYFYSQKKCDIFPLSKISFEGLVFNAPCNPEKALTSFYGPDFMCLPSEQNRTTHQINVKYIENINEEKV